MITVETVLGLMHYSTPVFMLYHWLWISYWGTHKTNPIDGSAQIKASEDSRMKFSIANAIVRAKIARNLQVLDWLAQRYDIERRVQLTKHEAFRLGKARGVMDLRTAEGRIALRYRQACSSVIPECFDFHGHMTSSHQNNVSDPVSLALNYAYGVLEGECREAINTVGLEPSVGFTRCHWPALSLRVSEEPLY